jgi:hypothetical protein
MALKYPDNPSVQELGKAHIDIAQCAIDPVEAENLSSCLKYSFPFVWGETRRQPVKYFVDDPAIEVGFLINMPGLPANVISPGQAMFTSLLGGAEGSKKLDQTTPADGEEDEDTGEEEDEEFIEEEHDESEEDEEDDEFDLGEEIINDNGDGSELDEDDEDEDIDLAEEDEENGDLDLDEEDEDFDLDDDDYDDDDEIDQDAT